MKVPVAIVGLGGVADRIHLPACKTTPAIDVIAGCDPNPEARRAMAAKFGIPRVFENDEEMLHHVRPQIVIVGTPPSSHYEICARALNAGAHVFCEKPFMSTVDEADRIIELAAARNLLLRVNNQYRFMTIYREVKQRLERGDFGRLFYIQVWQQMFHPPAKETNWRNQLTQYVLYEFGTHALDLVSYFFDALPVSATFHMPRCRPEFDSDVVVNGALRFEGERLASLSFNRISHAPEKYLEMRLDCEKASLRLSLGGVARCAVEWSKAARRPILKAAIVKGGLARAEAEGRSKTISKAPEREFASATAEHLKFFLSEMERPRRSTEAAAHAREILRLVFAGYESARTGETVWLNAQRAAAAD